MRGVLWSIDAEAEHGIVARALTFLTQPFAGHPEQRIEPVDASQELCRHVHQPVPAANVRELVTENDAHAVLGPVARRSGQNHFGPKEPPRDQQRRVITLQHPDGTAQSMRLRERLSELDPFPVEDPLRP